MATGEADVQVQKGASITTNGTDGLILLMGHHVDNDGYLSSPSGQVALVAGSWVTLTKATGTSDSTDPNVRACSSMSPHRLTPLHRRASM
ncbi:MAG: hypothetical protein WDN50_06380 [Bradyrhizobium sp.]